MSYFFYFHPLFLVPHFHVSYFHFSHFQRPRLVVCRLETAVDCALSVVSQECGQQIASYLRILSSELLDQMDCNTRKRQ